MVHEFGIYEHIEEMDKNDDGYLDLSTELPKNASHLHLRADADQDGRLHVNEMVDHFIMTEDEMLDEDVNMLMAKCDSNADGEIGWNEAHEFHHRIVEFHSHDRHVEPITHWKKWELR
jgi:Ca2+-binding EF-hand superfamily protein